MTSSGSRTGVTVCIQSSYSQNNSAEWTAMPPGTSGRRLDSQEVSRPGCALSSLLWPSCAVSSLEWPRLVSTTASGRARLETPGLQGCGTLSGAYVGLGDGWLFFPTLFQKLKKTPGGSHPCLCWAAVPPPLGVCCSLRALVKSA